MAKALSQTAGGAKQDTRHTLGRWALQILIWTLVAAWIFIIESKSYDGAVAVYGGSEDGKKIGAISLIFAALGFITSAVSSHFKNDVRPHVAKWARSTSMAAYAFLVIPTFFLAQSFSWDTLQREWKAYEGSPAYMADQRTLADPLADRYDRENARQRLTQPTQPEPGIEYLAAALLQWLLIWAGDALRIPAKASDAEVRHWRAVEAARKGAQTRAKNKAAREKRKAQEQKAARPRFTIFAGGKK